MKADYKKGQITFHWWVKDFKILPELENNTDVIYEITWGCEGTIPDPTPPELFTLEMKTKSYSYIATRVAAVTYNSTNDFIPFSDISTEIAHEWLPEDIITSMEEEIINYFDSQQS